VKIYSKIIIRNAINWVHGKTNTTHWYNQEIFNYFIIIIIIIIIYYYWWCLSITV